MFNGKTHYKWPFSISLPEGIWGYDSIIRAIAANFQRRRQLPPWSPNGPPSTAQEVTKGYPAAPKINGFWGGCFWTTVLLILLGNFSELGESLWGGLSGSIPIMDHQWLVLCPDFCWLSHQLPWIGLVASNCVNPPVTIQKLMDFHSKLLEFRISIISLPDVW